MNVAAELARRGRKVLVVDFDLEAPALDTAGRLRPNAWHAGVVEYVSHYLETGQQPDVRGYGYDAGPVGEKGGRIWVMPAGARDLHYRHALARLDWLSLYQSHDGFGFLNRMKEQWENLIHPDYVLIDCRAGRTNVAGTCTRQLPDAVVALFFPDQQNLVGLKSVCRDICTETRRGRPKPITLQFVLSNIPRIDDEENEGQELARLRDASVNKLRTSELGGIFTGTLHHQDGLVTVDRRPLVLERPNTRLAREYRDLVDGLIAHNVKDREGGLLFLQQMEEAYSQQSAVGGEFEEEEKRLDRFREENWDDPAFLVRLACCLMTGERYPDAERIVDRVLDDLQPTHAEALLQRFQCRARSKDKHGAGEALRAYFTLPNLNAEQILAAWRQTFYGAISFDDALVQQAERILAALRDSYELAPEQFDDLRRNPEVQALLEEKSPDGLWRDVGDPPQLSQKLSAVDQLRLVVLLCPEKPPDLVEWWHLTPEQRLRRKIRHLRKRIEELSARTPANDEERNWNAFHLANDWFALALAQWEATGDLPTEPCARGLGYHARVDDDFKGNYRQGRLKEKPPYRQLLALALWGVGRIREAKDEIDLAEASVIADPADEQYESPWRGCERVTREQFLNDCREILDQLSPDVPCLRPLFLSEPHADG